jgi:hypothetical protein
VGIEALLNEHLVGLWYVEYAEGSWMGFVWSEPTGPRAAFRLRTYVDDRVFADSEDLTSLFDIKPPPNKQTTLESLIQTLRDMADFTTRKQSGKLYELLRGEVTHAQFMHELGKLPFIHVTVEFT